MDRYGFLGPKGTHCEEALEVYLGQKEVESVAFSSTEPIIAALVAKKITHGIVPLENSIEGTVNLTVDLLARETKIKIVGEVIQPIAHIMLARPGLKKEEVTMIVSHPQALAQCRNYLNQNFPGIPTCQVNSTAEAAQMAAEAGSNLAAIGNERAAANYGLRVLARNVQDWRDNWTRFVVISTREEPVTGTAKTSMVISITDRPGGLYQILREFALANINLTKIESRPAKRKLGDYLFFIDIIGYIEQPHIKECLAGIADMAASFRILGSYPVWNGQGSSTGESRVKKLSLKDLRQDIDIIDYQIVELLAKRTQLVGMVGELKGGWQTIRDESREREVLRRVKANAVRRGVDPDLLQDIYGIMFAHFTELQRKIQQSEQKTSY